MNRNSMIWLIVIVVLLAGALVLFGAQDTTDENGDEQNNNEPTNGEEPTNDENGDNATVPEGWETYESDEFDFSVAHPSEASVDIEAENHTKFTVLGSDNATGEITDGFTFTVSVYDKPEDQTLEEFAEGRLEENLQVGEEVEGVSETTLNGEMVYTYTTANLGEVVHYALDHGGDRAAVVSYNIADPNDEGYQDMVDTMLSTLELSS